MGKDWACLAAFQLTDLYRTNANAVLAHQLVTIVASNECCFVRLAEPAFLDQLTCLFGEALDISVAACFCKSIHCFRIDAAGSATQRAFGVVLDAHQVLRLEHAIVVGVLGEL